MLRGWCAGSIPIPKPWLHIGGPSAGFRRRCSKPSARSAMQAGSARSPAYSPRRPLPTMEKAMTRADEWPSLPFSEWRDTCGTLHMWTQVIGKIRLAQAPLINHWWQVPLYVTSRGLTTSPIPYGARTFQIDFDFIDHRLAITTNDGATECFALPPF